MRQVRLYRRIPSALGLIQDVVSKSLRVGTMGAFDLVGRKRHSQVLEYQETKHIAVRLLSHSSLACQHRSTRQPGSPPASKHLETGYRTFSATRFSSASAVCPGSSRWPGGSPPVAHRLAASSLVKRVDSCRSAQSVICRCPSPGSPLIAFYRGRGHLQALRIASPPR